MNEFCKSINHTTQPQLSLLFPKGNWEKVF